MGNEEKLSPEEEAKKKSKDNIENAGCAIVVMKTIAAAFILLAIWYYLGAGLMFLGFALICLRLVHRINKGIQDEKKKIVARAMEAEQPPPTPDK